MKKKYIYLIAGLVIILVAAVFFKKKKGGGRESNVFTDVVYISDITESVSANGKIQPETNVKISSEISGEIIELNVVEGQFVNKGDLMIKINPDIYISSLNRAEASLNSAKADLASSRARLLQAESALKNAKRIFERNETLYAQGAISEAEFDNRKTEYDQAFNEVEAQKELVNAASYRVSSSKATRKEASDNLKRTTIYAPADGTVSGLQVEKGERVVGTGQMAGTPLMDIAEMDVMEVNVEVNESDIVRVSMGDTAIIEVDAYLKKKFLGVVTEIANAASGGSAASMDQVTNFNVKIRILNSSYKDLLDSENFPFKPGMSATVEIQTETVRSVLSVPIEAVTTREDTSSSAKSYDRYKKKGKRGEKNGDNNEVTSDSTTSEKQERKTRSRDGEKLKDQLFTLVFVVEEGKAVIKLVETGIQDDEFIEILSGLEEDDEIIIGPYDLVSRKLTNGSKVEITSKEEFYSGKED